MIKKATVIILSLALILVLGGCERETGKGVGEEKKEVEEVGGGIVFPSPRVEEGSLEEVILKRRSKREFKDKALLMSQVGQILWVGQGVTDKERGFRSAPSAGALYPLTLYLVVGERGVEGLGAGVYRYKPGEHMIERGVEGDVREDLAKACVGQGWVGEAPAAVVVVADYKKTTQKYGERGRRYVLMEAGHVGQNILLEAVSLGLGVVSVGAFDDEEVKMILGLEEELVPLYVIPVGYAKD